MKSAKEIRDWRAANPGERLDLYGAYLYGADLSGADLSGADLSRAYLSDANLSEVNLYGANLSRVNLSRVNLYGADLSGADLSGANFYGANLSRANFYGANLSRAKGVLLAYEDGYIVYGIRFDDGPRIAAGCRWFTVAEAVKHWSNDHLGSAIHVKRARAAVRAICIQAAAHDWPLCEASKELAQ